MLWLIRTVYKQYKHRCDRFQLKRPGVADVRRRCAAHTYLFTGYSQVPYEEMPQVNPSQPKSELLSLKHKKIAGCGRAIVEEGERR